MMRRSVITTCGMAGLAFAIGCATRPPSRDGEAATRSRSSSSSAAHRAVKAAADAWAGAAVARDAAEMTRHFAEDAFVMYPQPRPTVGRAANGAAWARVFGRPGALHPLTSDSVAVAASGDLAYTMGRWHLSSPADSARAAVKVGGRYLAIWRPVGPGGAWQIVALSANTHQPPPEM